MGNVFRGRQTLHRMIAWLGMMWTALAVFAQAPTPPPAVAPNLNLVANGSVSAIVELPYGSVVVGGDFTTINGNARRNLARFTAAGALDQDWNPAADGVVSALAVAPDGSVYVGGSFVHVNGVPRERLARIQSGPAGELDLDWSVAADWTVTALGLDGGGALYVGGQFTQLAGVARAGLGKVQVDGTVDSDWNPAPDGMVRSLTIDDAASLVYVGGGFTAIGGGTINAVARLSASGNGALDASWNPQVVSFSSNYVSHIIPDGQGSIFLAGGFTSVGGVGRQFIAKVSEAPGVALDETWAPMPSAFSTVIPALGDDGWLYVSGSFTSIGGLPRNRYARLETSGTGAADPGWDVGTSSAPAVALLPTSDGEVYVGGLFTSIAGMQRLGLARLAATGVPRPELFDVERPGAVRGVMRQPDGATIFFGPFLKINGSEQRFMGRLATNGALDPTWKPNPNLEPRAIAIHPSGDVFVSGPFNVIGGQTRYGLAKLAGAGAGEADPVWAPVASPSGVNVYALAVVPAGDVYVGGFFSTIGGASRTNLAKLSGAGVGTADAIWAANANNTVLQLAHDGADSLYAAGWFTSAGGLPRNRIARFSAVGAGGVDADWNPAPEHGINPGLLDVRAVLPDGEGRVYVAGAFTGIGGAAHGYLARLTHAGLADLSWNPEANFNVSGMALGDDDSLFVVGQFSQIGGAARAGLARLWRNDSGTADPSWSPQPDVQPATVQVYPNLNRVVVGGFFTAIGGRSRVGLAVLPGSEEVLANSFELP